MVPAAGVSNMRGFTRRIRSNVGRRSTGFRTARLIESITWSNGTGAEVRPPASLDRPHPSSTCVRFPSA
jgi:hypothetical protein